MALHVKKGDNVLVLAGKDKGKTGKVLSADPKNNRVVVDGVNIITKHNKPRSAQVPGGIEKTNGTIDSIDEWGKRRLAYEIDYEQEGYYVLVNFTAPHEFPAELDRIYKITEGVIRSLIIAKEN